MRAQKSFQRRARRRQLWWINLFTCDFLPFVRLERQFSMSPFDFFKARAENLRLSQCLINVNRLAECCAEGGGLVSALSLCCWAWMFHTCVRSDIQTCYSRSKTLESGGSRLWLPVPNLSEPRWQVPSSGCGLLCASEYKAEAPFDPECKKNKKTTTKKQRMGEDGGCV